MPRATAQLKLNAGLLALAGKRGQEGKDAAAIMRQALKEGALYWWKHYLPQHFEQGAGRRYPGAYRSRSAAYRQRKRAKKGHDRPMVWSGEMRDTLVRNQPGFEERKNARQVKVTLRLAFARAANLWRGGNRKHNFPESITAINVAEQRTLRTIIENAAARLMGVELSRGRVLTKRHAA